MEKAFNGVNMVVIKRFWKTLCVKNKGVAIVTDKKKIIPYEDILKIEYCYRSGADGGYIDFHDEFNHYTRFSFEKKHNALIKEAVEMIAELNPDMDIEEHHPQADPIYSRNIFIGIMAIIFPLISIILCWCTGKRTTQNRIVFTLVVIGIHIYLYWILYMIYISSFNHGMDMLNEYLNSLPY